MRSAPGGTAAPAEREDPAADDPERVAELSGLLETWLAGQGGDREARSLTDEETARLALGYVE